MNQIKKESYTYFENKLKQDFVISIIEWQPATEHFIKNHSKAPPVNTAPIIVTF